MPVQLVVGVLPDAAGVEHDDVGGVEIVGGLHAVGREQARDALRVVLVHLAPVGAQVEAARSVGRVERCHGRSVYGRPPIRPVPALACAAVHVGVGEFVVAALVVLFGALVQGTIGFGLNLLAAPFIALVLPEALPVTVVLVGVADGRRRRAAGAPRARPPRAPVAPARSGARERSSDSRSSPRRAPASSRSSWAW